MQILWCDVVRQMNDTHARRERRDLRLDDSDEAVGVPEVAREEDLYRSGPRSGPDTIVSARLCRALRWRDQNPIRMPVPMPTWLC